METDIVGWLPRDADDVGTGESGSLEDGTLTRIQVRISRETGRVDEAVFNVAGDADAVESARFVTGWLLGLTVEEAQALEPLRIVAELELPIERAAVAARTVEAARNALAHWTEKSERHD